MVQIFILITIFIILLLSFFSFCMSKFSHLSSLDSFLLSRFSLKQIKLFYRFLLFTMYFSILFVALNFASLEMGFFSAHCQPMNPASIEMNNLSSDSSDESDYSYGSTSSLVSTSPKYLSSSFKNTNYMLAENSLELIEEDESTSIVSASCVSTSFLLVGTLCFITAGVITGIHFLF